MTIQTTTHLNFRGDARAALDFYAAVFGGRTAITTYADAGMPGDLPGADRVLFGLAVSDDGFRLMAYDVPGAAGGTLTGGGSTRRQNGTTLTDQALFVSATGDTLAQAQGIWDGLVEGATVAEPLAASAWSAGFGMLTDRYGVTWSVGVTAA